MERHLNGIVDQVRALRSETANRQFAGRSRETIAIGAVATIVFGRRVGYRLKGLSGGTIPYVRPADVKDANHLMSTGVLLTEEGAAKGVRAPAGSVALVFKGQIGSAAVLGEDACLNDELLAMVPKANWVAEYLRYWVLSRKQWLLQHASKGDIPVVARRTLEDARIPLVGRAEQLAIVKELDARIAQTRRFHQDLSGARRMVAECHQAALDDMVKQVRSTERVRAQLWQVVENIRASGIARSSQAAAISPVVCIADIQRGTIILDAPSPASSDNERALQVGDILVVQVPRDVGSDRRIAVVAERQAGWLFGRNILRLRPNRRFVLPEFLAAYLRTPLVENDIIQAVGRSERQFLTEELLRRLAVDVPPLEDQQRIMERLASQSKQLAVLEAKIEGLVREIEQAEVDALAAAFPN